MSIFRPIIIMTLFLCAFSAVAVTRDENSPRRGAITPVDNDRSRPEQPHLHFYDRHGNPLPEPVLFLVEEKDTVVSPRSPYPLYNGVTVGADFLEAIMMACGQSYASVGLNASVSLHNWLFPAIEAGLGWADNHPDGSNFRYKALPTPYFRLGLNYNFLYKSSPDYNVCLGLFAGYSATRYDINDISIPSNYWPESHPVIPRQSAHIFWGDVRLGIKVKVVGPLSLGWKGRCRFKFKASECAESTPWFFPGYGANSAFSADFSAYITF